MYVVTTTAAAARGPTNGSGQSNKPLDANQAAMADSRNARPTSQGSQNHRARGCLGVSSVIRTVLVSRVHETDELRPVPWRQKKRWAWPQEPADHSHQLPQTGQLLVMAGAAAARTRNRW